MSSSLVRGFLFYYKVRSSSFLLLVFGGVSEWLKETGCKPVGIAYSGSNPLAPTICGSSSAGRASAFQAEGREFESRLPLYYYYYYYYYLPMWLSGRAHPW